LQKEITSLKEEIDRISEGTNFNGIKLLDGSMGSYQATADIAAVDGVIAKNPITIVGGKLDGADAFTVNHGDDGAVTLGSVTIGGETYADAAALAAAGLNLSTVTPSIGNNGTYTFKITLGDADTATAAAAEAVGAGISITVNTLGKPAADATYTFTVAGTAGTKAAGGSLSLQIGDTAESFNQLEVSVGSMSTDALGIGSIDISTQAGAKSAVDLIKNAINTVSSTRGDLGAIQNRLEHTINNLSVTTENMTAAESRIRDVDMANEMMAYTKNNILVQASQAMLAQANQIPQGVLQLLQ
ncbi:flagellin, partial [Extibacter muris]